jgi:hypothetical protein
MFCKIDHSLLTENVILGNSMTAPFYFKLKTFAKITFKIKKRVSTKKKYKIRVY